MICENCGKEIKTLFVDFFEIDGSDNLYELPLSECENGAVYVDANPNWTGYDLTEEEQKDSILCPNCSKFPFKNEEIQVHEIVRVVCFKSKKK